MTLRDEYGDTGIVQPDDEYSGIIAPVDRREFGTVLHDGPADTPLCHRTVERYCGARMRLVGEAWVCPDCGQKRFVDVSGYPEVDSR